MFIITTSICAYDGVIQLKLRKCIESVHTADYLSVDQWHNPGLVH